MCPNPDCGGRTVAFPAPPALRDHAPEGAAHAAVCARCLRTFPAAGADPDPSSGAVLDAFPEGEAGAALALALGRLDRLALERSAVVACCEHAARPALRPERVVPASGPYLHPPPCRYSPARTVKPSSTPTARRPFPGKTWIGAPVVG